MPDNKNDQDKAAADKLAAEKLAAEKLALTSKAQMPAKSAAVGEYKVDPDTQAVTTGNFTRDAIIDLQRGKFVEQGKSSEEALELAIKRGFEMVKPEKKPQPEAKAEESK